MARGRRPRGDGEAALPAGDDTAERNRILDAALACIARDGWRGLSLAAVAGEAGLPILRIYRRFTSKSAILAGFFRRIDEAVLAAPPEGEEGEKPRDRVFDLLMRRFDALQPYRDALAVLARELPTDPLPALAAGARLLHAMRWMLEAADIPTGGLHGAVVVKLTTAAYLATLRSWLRDETPDLAPTMAALDRRLRSIEWWYGTPRRRGIGAAAASA